MNKSKLRKTLVPLLFVFIIVNTSCLVLKDFLAKNGIDYLVVFFANFILFLLAALGALRHYKALQNSNPHAFVRSVLSATVLKLFVIAGSVFGYILVAGESRSINAVLLSMGLYIVYTAIEVTGASKLNKQANGNK